MDEQKIKHFLDARTAWVLSSNPFVRESVKEYDTVYKDLSDEEKEEVMKRLCWGEEI